MNTIRMVSFIAIGLSGLMWADMLVRGDSSPPDVASINRPNLPAPSDDGSDPMTYPVSVIPPTWDIVGLKPGLTPDQARKVLNDYNKSGKFWPVLEKWADDTDFVRTLAWDTSGFAVDDQNKKTSIENLVMVFSGPATGNRLLSVKRSIVYLPDYKQDSSTKQLRESLHDKYGVSPEAELFKGFSSQTLEAKEKIILTSDGDMNTDNHSYGRGFCSVVVGDDVTTGFGSFDTNCGTATLSWDVKARQDDSNSIEELTIELKDIDFAVATSKFDKLAFDKVKQDIAKLKLSKTGPKL